VRRDKPVGEKRSNHRPHVIRHVSASKRRSLVRIFLAPKMNTSVLPVAERTADFRENFNEKFQADQLDQARQLIADWFAQRLSQKTM
jgi:hypothetical protein